MKKTFLLITILIASNNLFSQKVVFEKEYSQFPFEVQIDNSGIYSIASFDIHNDIFSFSSFTKEGIFEFSNGNFLKSSEQVRHGKDFIVSIDNKEQLLKKTNSEYSPKETILFKKNFLKGKSILKDDGGNISGSNGEKIVISVHSRDELIITTNIVELKNEIIFKFPTNLACADLIGIDKSGNLFVIVEKYLSDIPLKIEREVYTISPNGNLLSRLLLPNIKYLYTLKDLQIDHSGNLYHLLSYTDKAVIVKWDNLTMPSKEMVEYSNEYSERIHFNDFVPTDEIASSDFKNRDAVQSSASRTEALKIADTYVLHQYECTSSNLAPSNITAPDGDIIRTPDWLIVGTNARIPYKWGGFNTLAQFDAGLANGKYAGDINTDGVSPNYAYGVDCSGYVSRCWQLSYHSSTRNMPSITTQYDSWDDLKPGDGIHKIGHVRLFIERNVNGSIKLVESTSRGWGVSYYSYSISDLSAYTPRYYNKMENNFNNSRPNLISAEFKSENSVLLKWNCDTSGVIGFRIYSSEDGKTWDIIVDENSCKVTSAEVNRTSTANYFRVSSVKNDSPDFSESNWSNVLGVSSFESEKKALIVDGFERESGSWRGAGHTFISKYGRSLEALSIDFISIKNSELINGLFQLNNYDYIFWILGDESTVDETFNSAEQALVTKYLENGGNLFVSGSEIGWDLDHKGSTQDKYFFNNYLKANYLSDDAGYPTSAYGLDNTPLAECNLNFGQTYEEDYPDEIETLNGSSLCMKYSNGKGAGIEYTGFWGSSTIKSSLIYIAFPLETTANNESFNKVISSAVIYFNSPKVGVIDDEINFTSFSMAQNYPNPFNPSTTIKFTLPKAEIVLINIYNILGEKVAELVNREMDAGYHLVNFNAEHLSSGSYFFKISAGNFSDVKKMILLR